MGVSEAVTTRLDVASWRAGPPAAGSPDHQWILCDRLSLGFVTREFWAVENGCMTVRRWSLKGSDIGSTQAGTPPAGSLSTSAGCVDSQ